MESLELISFAEPAAADRGKECEWEVTQDAEFKIYDYTTKTSTLLEVRKLMHDGKVHVELINLNLK